MRQLSPQMRNQEVPLLLLLLQWKMERKFFILQIVEMQESFWSKKIQWKLADSTRRGSKAVRMTVDHKASDPDEQKRIKDMGGIILGDKVAGILPYLEK